MILVRSAIIYSFAEFNYTIVLGMRHMTKEVMNYLVKAR